MKKLLVPLFILCALFVGVRAVQAFSLDDALLKIDNLQKELSQLKSSLTGSVLGASTVATCTNGATNYPTCTVGWTPPSTSTWDPITCANGAMNSPSCTILTTPTIDLTPRISYWSGKVNQHVDMISGTWQTDVDGTSGAGINKLTYCKKFYPNTTSVVEYKNETINSWQNAGNTGNLTSTKMSYQCVGGTSIMCKDSDGGINFANHGAITYRNLASGLISTDADSCFDFSLGNVSSCKGTKCGIYEYYCNEVNSRITNAATIKTCAYGCSNGACLNSTATASPVSVLTPGGGETLTSNTSYKIQWSDPASAMLVNKNNGTTYFYYNLTLEQAPLCTYFTNPDGTTGSTCTAPVTPKTYTIVKSLKVAQGIKPNMEWSWTVGKITSGIATTSFAPDGTYKIKICKTGTTNCDYSGSFNITKCTNGATNYPTCTIEWNPPSGWTFDPITCSNGATNYPTCTVEWTPPSTSTWTPITCANGATNYPICTM